MIEVFKTNVTASKAAHRIVKSLSQKWDNVKVNFDMEDCDKILRIEGTSRFKNRYIIAYLAQLGYSCEILE